VWLAFMAPVGTASAQSARISFGDDVVVARGETVREVVTMGGDATVAGTVLGDVVTMGGDLQVLPGGSVRGDIVTFGGDVRFDSPPVPAVRGGQRSRGRHHHDGLGFLPAAVLGGVGNLLWSAACYGGLFLLGLLLMGIFRERFGAAQVTIVRQPLRAGALGLVGLIGAVIAIVILAVTIVGIPLAILAAALLPVVCYVGMAVAAAVIGAALPIERLGERPVLRLFAGVAVLFIASLVPIVGTLFVAAAAVVGIGALFITRGGCVAPPPTGEGPYRTASEPLAG